MKRVNFTKQNKQISNILLQIWQTKLWIKYVRLEERCLYKIKDVNTFIPVPLIEAQRGKLETQEPLNRINFR